MQGSSFSLRPGRASADPAAPPPLLAGRYRVETEIARGAMGAVSSAVDVSTGKRVALKQLISTDPKLVRMFEREFHTLVGLRHPRIIEVYDYGVASSGPFYTMELLDGHDFRELAPIDYKRACHYLRDIASSLGLLHARRLLHRDLSPRNARVTSDDRCKLIDFGGLSGFGIPHLVVGTPPCVPPEALHHAPLDQRADLYALGALGYWLLTGRHAYPAREMTVLPEAWRTLPSVPSLVVAALGREGLSPVPPALDELVMGLLTLNPLGRPASAADVIDRLTVIGELPRESDDGSSRSYLLGVETVGRKRERERLKRRLSSALERSGSCVIIEAASGMGGTRLLGELSVAAQLAGAMPIVVDGRMHRGPYGLVHGLVEKALEAAPKDALAAAVGHEALLARISPVLATALNARPDETDFTGTPGELRKRTQNALSAYVLALARRRPLLLAIDNLQRVDEPSAALLATLASRAAGEALLIACCIKPNEELSATIAVRALRQAGASMVLRGLGRDDVHALVRAMFGDVPNVARLSEWMHRLSAGNPQACMDLAAHLVRHKVIRYIQGSWALPQAISADELRGGLGELVARRLSELPDDARRLAEALSVHRGYLPLERCHALAEIEGVTDAFEALEVLVGESILVSTADGYQLAHDSIQRALVESIPKERRRALHVRMGALIAKQSAQVAGDGLNTLENLEARLDAGWHLLHGGEEERGADLLAAAGLELTHASDGLTAAVPALRAALAVYRAHGRSAYELVTLLGPLAMAGYYTDRKLADELGEDACAVMEEVIGLRTAARLRRFLGPRLALFASLGLGAVRFLLRGRGGMNGYVRTIEMFSAAVMCLVGTATVCLDATRAQRLAARLEPLSWLGKDTGAAHVHRMATLMALVPEERVVEVIEGLKQLVARVEDPRRIPLMEGNLRKQFHAGLLYGLGSMQVFCDGPGGLRTADQLDQVGLKLYEMVADQLRSSYHAMRGEVERAETYRARVEVHGVQSGSAWQVEVWVPSSRITVYVLTADTIGLKRTMEEIDRLAQEIPSLRRNAVLARGEYHHLKGEHAEGFALVEPELQATRDREFIGRTFAIANKARALNRLGRHAEAKALVEPAIARLSAADMLVVTLYASTFRELAHALAGLGDHEAAFDVLDAMLARHAQSDHPLLLGSVHASATAVALLVGDVARALEHVTHMEHWFRPTANPALIAQCERLRREVKRLVEGQLPGGPPVLVSPDTSADESIASARSMLSQCQGSDQRAQFALDLLLNHVHARSGFLFAVQDGELSLVAPQHGDEPATELIERVKGDLGRDDEQATVVVDSNKRASLPPPVPIASNTETYRTFPLTLPGKDELRVVGVLAVSVGERALQPPQQAFLQAIARSLFEAGDAGSKTETQVRRM